MDIRTALKQAIARLRKAQVASDTLAAEVLLMHALGCERAWIYAHPEEEMSDTLARGYAELVMRRSCGEPTQHITGTQEFWGLPFHVDGDVLIPRPETEHVVEVALDRLGLREARAGRSSRTDGTGLRVADVGTGSGCMAIALAKELPGAVIFATDNSAAALHVARSNAARNGVSERVEFILCNLLEGVSAAGAVDQSPVTSHQSLLLNLVVSNPPYIGRNEAASLPREVWDHEPHIALFAGPAGHELYPELIAQSAERLKAGGILVLELGWNSLAAVRPMLDAARWTRVGVTNDLAGIPRVIAAERL